MDVIDISNRIQWPEASTWPSLEEIFGDHDDHRLPNKLKLIIAERYIAHSSEYICEPKEGLWKHRNSPLPVNLCMEKDNLQDVEEELVDATFNALIYAMRYPQSNAASLLHSLVTTWDILQRERKRVADNGAA